MKRIDILFASDEPFHEVLIKKLTREHSLSTYVLSNSSEINYIIDDLMPRVILCTACFWQKHHQVLSRYLLASNAKKIYLGDTLPEEFEIQLPENLEVWSWVDNMKEFLR